MTAMVLARNQERRQLSKRTFNTDQKKNQRLVKKIQAALNTYNFAIAHFPSICRARVCEISVVIVTFVPVSLVSLEFVFFFWYPVALGVGNNNGRRVPSSWYERHVEIGAKDGNPASCV